MSAPSAPSVPQRVFEGPDPERLLLEAWSIHGTQVRITEPVTVRRGGVLGFFAKAHYRIEVMPGSPLEAAEPVTGEVPRAMPPFDDRTAATAKPAPAPRVARSVVAPSVMVGTTLGTAGALDALVAATEDRVDLDTTRRGSFDRVLETVASSLGDEPASLAATLPAEPASAPGTPPGEPGRRVAPSSLERPVVASRPWTVPEPEPEPEVVDPALAGLREQLVTVGFPADLLAGAASSPRTLLDAFSLAPRPRPLPRTPGSLVAVVGPLTVAKDIAEQLGVPSEHVARARRTRSAGEQASALVVHDEQEAADLAPGWRRDRVGVVAVSVTSLSRDGAWARNVLRALAPSMTIALASATAKAEDIGAFCAAIGGVDALVIEGLEATLTPASVLATGIPVGMLDAMPADAATWADVATRALARRSAEA